MEEVEEIRVHSAPRKFLLDSGYYKPEFSTHFIGCMALRVVFLLWGGGGVMIYRFQKKILISIRKFKKEKKNTPWGKLEIRKSLFLQNGKTYFGASPTHLKKLVQ
jgi:hypothetical protein